MSDTNPSTSPSFLSISFSKLDWWEGGREEGMEGGKERGRGRERERGRGRERGGGGEEGTELMECTNLEEKQNETVCVPVSQKTE